MPGARANGILAYTAMTSVAIMETRAVVVNSAPLSMPVLLMTDGLTARI